MKEKMQDRLKDGSLEGWKRRKIELKLKLGNDGWEPTKKIAVSSMEKIRLLNAEFPEVWTMKRLSEQFKVSQETIRRIIKSKYRPDADKIEKREQKRRTQMRSYKLQENAHI
ncbi:Required for respiratory growth protein 9 mitochondrial [Coemansia sp. RSA 1722]|nr:Required for respiratory growth protein 9 mitochondrial [Coemansia sp. RSA 1722]